MVTWHKCSIARENKPIRIHDFPAMNFDWLKRIKDGRLSCDNFIIFVHSFVQTAGFQEEAKALIKLSQVKWTVLHINSLASCVLVPQTYVRGWKYYFCSPDICPVLSGASAGSSSRLVKWAKNKHIALQFILNNKGFEMQTNHVSRRK